MVKPRLPWIATTLTLGAIAAQAVPDLARRLEFDVAASLSGELWRPFTGHLCHYSQSHFIGDVAAFLVWASVVELISRRLLVGALLGTSTLLALWLMSFGSTGLRYRGLSAIDCALATQIFITTCRSPYARRVPWLCGALVGVALLMLAKSLFEFASGHAIMAPNLGSGVRLLPEAHVVGVVVGIVTVRWETRRIRGWLWHSTQNLVPARIASNSDGGG